MEIPGEGEARRRYAALLGSHEPGQPGKGAHRRPLPGLPGGGCAHQWLSVSTESKKLREFCLNYCLVKCRTSFDYNGMNV